MKIGILEPGFPPSDLQPRFGTYGGMFARLLGAEVATIAFDVRRGEYPDAAGFDGYIITGSAAGVYDELSWIPQLKAWTRDRAVDAPMVGVCFGHQLMAEAFGGRVEKSDKGWGVGLHTYEINTTAPWMDRDARTLTVPASHQDQVVEIAPGTEVLGGSGFCPFGFLAYPDLKAISLQLHPEFDPAYAEALIATRRDGPLEPAVVDAAIASLKAPNDNDKVGGWLKRFLGEG